MKVEVVHLPDDLDDMMERLVQEVREFGDVIDSDSQPKEEGASIAAKAKDVLDHIRELRKELDLCERFATKQINWFSESWPT